MTNLEFSTEFDILYNNIASNIAPNLNNYEKSVLLTQAQEAIILDIYRGTFNANSFENSEEVTSYINHLVKQETISSFIEGADGISKNSKLCNLPEDLWFITYESAILEDDRLGCKDGNEVLVKPITQDTYYKIKRNPFKRDNYNRVLRLTIDNKSELISEYNIKSYLIRYMAKPEPIILEDLTDYGVSIDGKTRVTECKLNPAIHRVILRKAVDLAKLIWTSGNNE